MIRLLSLHVGEARHLEGVEIAFAPKGLTLVSGPNEVGKSTLVACLGALLHHSFSARRAEIRELAGPRGAVEVRARFLLGDGGREHEVELTKRWLTRAFARLSVGGEHLEGREAEDRFEQLLRMAGVAPPADELLVRWLFEAQGTATAHRTPLLESRAFGDALRRQSGSAELVPPRLLVRAREELERYETASRGAPTGELRAQHDRLRSLAEERSRRAARLEQAAQLQERLADVLAELERLPEELSRAEAEEEGTSRELEELDQRLAGLSAVETAHELAAAELARVDRDWLAWATAEENRVSTITKLHELEGREQELRGRVGVLRAHLDELSEEETHEARRVDELRAEREEVERRTTAEQAAVQQDQLRRQLAEIEELRAARAALEASPPRTIDAAAIARLRALEAEVAAARRGLAERGPRIVLDAAETTEVLIDGAPTVIGPGQPLERAVVDPTTVQVGQLALTVIPGAAREGLAEAERKRRALLAELAITDLTEAEQRLAQLVQYHRRLEELTDRLAHRLPPGTTEGDLRDQLRRLEAVRAPEPSVVPPRPLDEVVAELTERERALHSHQQRRLELATELADLERAGEDLRREIVTAEGTATALQRELERLGPREVLEAARAEQARRLRELEERLAALTEIRERREQLAHEVAIRRRERERWQTRLAELRADARALEARIGDAVGAFDAVSEIEEQIADTERRIARLEEERAAARLLLHVLEEANRAARDRFEGPYRRLLEELLSRVLSEPVEVLLDERLEVVGLRRPRRSQEALAPDQLSAGTREQLSLAVRFAATRLSGAVPVLLDDVLGFSDARRARLVVAELAALADDGQAIVFTAHPERYDAAGTRVAYVDLEDALRGTAVPTGPVDVTTPVPAPPTASPPSGDLVLEDDQLAEAVIQLLTTRRGELLGRSEIARALGVTPERTSAALRHLRDAGRVAQVGERRGARYRLADPVVS